MSMRMVRPGCEGLDMVASGGGPALTGQVGTESIIRNGRVSSRQPLCGGSNSHSHFGKERIETVFHGARRYRFKRNGTPVASLTSAIDFHI
jgi:hypothetical protein